MAPTLVTSCTALPPEGAGLAWGGPALAAVAPTLVTSCTALPPEGAGLAWGGPALAAVGAYACNFVRFDSLNGAARAHFSVGELLASA